MLPKARADKLSVREMVEETIIYDLERHKAHSLNGAAAFVWGRCDGQTSIEELARLLHTDLGLPRAEELVRLALDQLARRHLLEEMPSAPMSTRDRLSRREALKKLIVAGLAMPVIMTLTTRNTMASQTLFTSTGCPAGTKLCKGVNFGPTFPRTFLLCCTVNEKCINGACVAQVAGPPVPPCIHIGLPCAPGDICCTAGGGIGPCPGGGTC
jgi:hypothetical protein